MKKIFKIFTVNLILFCVLYFIVDMFCFVKILNYFNSAYAFQNPQVFMDYYLETYKRIFYTEENYDSDFVDGKRKILFIKFPDPVNVKSKKLPVLIMGCSFAYGDGLKPEQTFAAKLAKLTNRPVYNRAMPGFAANEMLYQLRSRKFYAIIPKPEWFIYVMFHDHIRRSQIPNQICYSGVYYDENLNIRPNITFPLAYAIKSNLPFVSDEKYFKHFLALLLEMRKEMSKRWGNDVKCMLLYYDEEDKPYKYLKPKLKDNGFLVYSLKDLTNKNLLSQKYKIADKVHPSEEAWNIITPALVEKAGL